MVRGYEKVGRQGGRDGWYQEEVETHFSHEAHAHTPTNFKQFTRLTSVHGDCDDTHVLVRSDPTHTPLPPSIPHPPSLPPSIPPSLPPSPPRSGYSHTVQLYDMHTGAIVRKYEEVHKDHINISR